MENQANSKSIILNYGLILGILGVLPSVIKYAMGGNYLENDMISGAIGLVLSIVIVFLAIKKFKGNNGEYMSWGQGLKVGMGVILISLLISIAYLFVFTNYIEPDFKNQAIELAQQKWIDGGMSSDQIETAKEMSEKYFNLSLYGAITVMGLFIGFVISAIISAIMKKSQEDQY